MVRLAVALLLFIPSSFGQDCIKYGAPTTLKGTLAVRDEAGYNRFIVFRPLRKICAVVDPKEVPDPSNEYYRRQSGVKEIQADVYASDVPATVWSDSSGIR